MDPLVGIGLILSLIPLWQHERDKKAEARKEDFFKWLLDHNFESIKEDIEKDVALSLQIENLLKLNHDELLQRFDAVDEKLMRLLYGVDEFREIVKHIFPRAALSKNEEHILTEFVNSGESNLYFVVTNMRCILQVGEQCIEGCDPRFIASNLRNLAKAGYIQLYKNSPGHEHYLLTELGAEYVKNIQGKHALSQQAKDILVQYYQTDKTYLTLFVDGARNVCGVMADGQALSFSDSKFVFDDLNSLAQNGLIKHDGELSNGIPRYVRTRKGNEYVAKILKSRNHADA